MKKTSIWKLLILIVLVISMCVPFSGCKNTQTGEPEQTTTQPATDPAQEQTDPEPTETQPQETDPEPVILQAGTMSKHMKGKNGDLGIYFMMEVNEIPADSSWETEFRPTSKNAVQLFRNGEVYDIGTTAAGMIIKYSDTEYYLKLEQWLLRDYFPIRDGDILKIEGIFRNAAIDVMFQIETSYIQVSEGLVFFSTEYPEGSGVNVKYVGNPTSHPNGKTSDGIYFKLDKNSVPYDDWKVEYSPATESAIQLIRNGKTYNIGNKAAGTIVKYSDTEYYLKLEKWIIKDFYPIRDGDVIVLNGKFVNSGVSTVFSISKTYISVNEGLLNFSTEYPSENAVEAQVIPAMLEHPNGFTGTGVYFKAAEANTLPFDGWSVEYFPREAGCIKLIRDGETYDIANIDAGTIVKYSDTEYYFKLEQWIYKDKFPFTDGDILIVEGKFVNAGLAGLMEIGKTYIAINGGMAYFSAEYPDGPVGPTKIQGGTMSSHPDGWKPETNGGLFFKMDVNDAPFATDWSLRYVPTTTDAIKLIRDGVTTNVANTAAEMIAKYREDSYYLEFWPISLKPIVEGDTLVIEGSFVNAANNVVLIIDKTYVTIENGQPVFTADKNVVIEAGHMQPHPNGWNTNNNEGLYFKLDANEVPYDGWNTEYEPVSAASIKLIRGEETFNIGIPGRGTVVKYSDTEYYLKLVAWTIGEYAPIVPGDRLIVEGEFKNADNGVSFSISRSVITVGEDYSLTFTAEEPVDETIQAGAMSSHPNGWNTQNNKGMYFTLASNEVPYTDDWQTFYYPTTEENIKLIRDGETLNVAQTDREFIVKYGDTDYYLKLEKWTIGDYFPLVPGDVVVVEGNFANQVSGVTFNISKTYITIGENYILTFSEEAPETPEPDVTEPETDGTLKPHFEKGIQINGMEHLIFAVMDPNSGVQNGWETEYTPVAAAGLKLVRDGRTYDVGNPGQGTLVKYTDTEYCLKIAPWTATGDHLPLTAGDQVIVEGAYIGRAGTPCEGSTIYIAKTTITYNADGTLTFASESAEPENPEVTEPDNHGPMAAHSVNGWTATGGLYFTMAANDVPYGDWNIRYTPTAESNVKLIRGGETYNVAHTQRETITKFSETEYYYEFWTLDTYKPIVAGDVMIVEGDFMNSANGATLSVAKTTITFNADGTATFQSEGSEPKDPEVTEPENTGLVMKAWEEKAWNTSSNGGFWFTMDSNDIPADETWVLEYTPVSEDVLKLVRNGETVNIAIPGRGTLIKANEAEYYLKLEWNIGDYDKTVTVGDQIIVEGNFTNATNGVTFTVKKTTVTIGANYVLTFQSEDSQPEDDAIQVGNMTENSGGITSGIIYFSLPDNDLPSSLTKSDFRPVDAGVIKLIRDGVTYDIADPNAKTVVKQTASKYRLLRSALTMELQTGDILVVDGKFTGGNTDKEELYTIAIGKTYIFIGDGTVTFSAELPAED